MEFHLSTRRVFLLVLSIAGQLVPSCSVISSKNQSILPDPSPSTRRFVVEKRIIGGRLVTDNMYPWAASLQLDLRVGFFARLNIKYFHMCGGTIIHSEWILTAAHCVANLNLPELWRVRVGSNYAHAGPWELVKNWFRHLYSQSLKSYYEVDEIITHPNFTMDGQVHDVALLKLKDSIPLSDISGFEVIQLPEKGNLTDWPFPKQTCTTVGWGCHWPGRPTVDQLNEVSLTITPVSYCRKLFYGNAMDGHKICAGTMWEGKGICVGDSGGALVCSGGGKVIMAGIGIGSQTESPGNYPSVFTRVSDYIDWIRSVIDQDPTS